MPLFRTAARSRSSTGREKLLQRANTQCMLDVLRPVERKHGSSSERRAAGACSGYSGASTENAEEEGDEMDDDEELANGVDGPTSAPVPRARGAAGLE